MAFPPGHIWPHLQSHLIGGAQIWLLESSLRKMPQNENGATAVMAPLSEARATELHGWAPSVRAAPSEMLSGSIR